LRAVNHFELFELPPTFELDLKLLDERYRALSQQWHPDKFVSAPANERLVALQKTTDINAGYKALRDPLTRSAYLLKLLGIDLDAEGERTHQMNPAFLMEILEKREALDEAKAAHDLDRAVALGKAIAAEQQATHGELSSLFAAQQKDPDPARLARLADRVAALRYHRRFLDEVAAIEDGTLP
jgi:molecular chaperone HscB